MATQVPFIFRASPLPTNFKGTPQQLLDAMVARLSAESEIEIAVFVTGSVAPSSNVGPWLKDGTTWYVWDVSTGSYIPQVVNPSSLGYIAQEDPPDPAIYTFWIQLDATGKAQSIQYYSSSAWHDIYEDRFATFQTIAAFNSAIANYSTTAQMNMAIASAIGGITSYPAQGANAAPQSVPVDAAPHQVVIDTAVINPSPSPLNTTTYRYVAPANGIYQVAVTTTFDNDTGTAAAMEVNLVVYKNGVDSGLQDQDGTPSPNGARWSPGLTALISLATNDYLELWVTLDDGVNSGNVDLTTFRFSVNRVSA